MALVALKTILVIITVLMLIFRVLAFGWFLFIFGIAFLLISALHLYAGWKFLNTMSFPNPDALDLLLFWGMNFFYIFFYLVQIDFNDAPNSTVIVLEKIIGKGKFTDYLIESKFNLMIYSLFPLLIVEITAIVLAARR